MRRLVAQRLFGLVLGYEDLNDHDELRDDSLLALAVECDDLTGENRGRDRGHPLAGSKTLNRLELGVPGEDDRYKKVVAEAVDDLQVDLFLEAYSSPPKKAGPRQHRCPAARQPSGRFFPWGCYLPLYIVCGDYVLCSRLRPSNVDGAAGSVEELARIVGRLSGHAAAQTAKAGLIPPRLIALRGASPRISRERTGPRALRSTTTPGRSKRTAR